ncbi:hypothetical protein, partial [Limosilactobacillus gorillae]|uniref:hypothetical protein n=1 Tax=Limosilactobacillus gorillae TaxID=1450649 RepID=UPI001F1BCE4A
LPVRSRNQRHKSPLVHNRLKAMSGLGLRSVKMANQFNDMSSIFGILATWWLLGLPSQSGLTRKRKE